MRTSRCTRTTARSATATSGATPRLAEVARSLGQDVPVCLAGTPAYFEGIGDYTRPSPPLPRLSVVLVNCGTPVATPAVFRARNGAFSAPLPGNLDASSPEALIEALAACRNDLTDAALTIDTQIAVVLRELAACTGARIARMSGSGGTCFAIFDDETAARAAARNLTLAHAGWWIACGRLISLPRAAPRDTSAA
ncbi:MAG TPA: hypothetical protein PK264_06460 [Hyphomicrobiaceae bacterium]|nr:hypothetical protein [Hyphomicrobiaceae bacterium]